MSSKETCPKAITTAKESCTPCDLASRFRDATGFTNSMLSSWSSKIPSINRIQVQEQTPDVLPLVHHSAH
jgi:hypothetical protein